MPFSSECLFPSLRPSTAYRKGCRCDRCREWKAKDYLEGPRVAPRVRHCGFIVRG